MDCLTARTTLDLVPPSAEGGTDAVQAAAHVAVCPECQAVVRARGEFDRRVGEVCRAVPVPAGLRESLLAQLAATPQPAEASAPAAVDNSRRQWVRWVVGAAVASLLLPAAVLVYRKTLPPQIPYETLAAEITHPELNGAGWPSLVSFGFGYPDVRPPQGVRLAAIQNVAPKALVVEDRTVGLWVFTLTDSRRKRMNARLIVAPTSAVQPPSGSGGTAGAWSIAFWSEGRLTYLLALEGPDRELRRLLPPVL
jgi:hypothetical protein